jgi:hypothetical protein
MKTINSKLLFSALQLADLLTTLACFRYGLVEMNTITAHLMLVFGVVGGLVVSKLLACAAVLPMKKLVWVGNVSYSIIVLWNTFLMVVFGLAHFAVTSSL